jgi:hypothetical protein
MAFEYSCFISYRRENQRNKFIENFRFHFNTFAFDACNKQDIFVDSKSILVGDDVPECIYNSIKNSYYFIVIHNYHYLNVKNIWCAKELKYALDVEKARIRLMENKDKNNYKWIFPLVIRGKLSDLPESLEGRNGKHIGCFEAVINSKKPLSKKVIEFFNEIYEKMNSLYKITENYSTDFFNECCKDIPYPTDAEIIDWIRDQKEKVKKIESNNTPILRKDGN